MQPVAASFLSRERSVAREGFNRWLVPPAAMSIHLCIGMAYGFSVFWLPMAGAVGGHQPIECGPSVSAIALLFVTTCDWPLASLGWIYTLFFVFLGSSAALAGSWVDRVGPRSAGAASALCWSGGLLLASIGMHLHQLWLILLGAGVLGGVGLGLGYVAPIATLMAWYPERRGLATGMGIMGFGGGAMVGSPLAMALMDHFRTETDPGVAATFAVLALVHLVVMMLGALSCRVPPAEWKPPGRRDLCTLIAADGPYVSVPRAWRLPQFWLLWCALCLNVSAGLGVIGMASPMLQEVFGGKLIAVPGTFGALDKIQRTAVAAVAAGFAALLSLFNIVGRLSWAAASDQIGRRQTFLLLFGIGAMLYASLSLSASGGDKNAFVIAVCLIVSMYGGVFATLPAYVADLFGPKTAGAIHARLLTALAPAGVLGPLIVNLMRDRDLALGVPHAVAYNTAMLLLSFLLLLGFACHCGVRAVHARHFEQYTGGGVSQRTAARTTTPTQHRSKIPPQARRAWDGATALLVWSLIGLPLAWGFYRTMAAAFAIAA